MPGARLEMAEHRTSAVLTVGGSLVNDLSAPLDLHGKRGKDIAPRKKRSACMLCRKPPTECGGYWRRSRCQLSPDYDGWTPDAEKLKRKRKREREVSTSPIGVEQGGACYSADFTLEG
jgi:hypothetical protein